MKKKKYNIEYKKVTVAFIFLLLFLSTVILFTESLSKTYTKYETNSSGISKIDYAYFILQPGYYTESVKLDSILPNINSYLYAFTVSNFKDDKRSDVDMTYELEIQTTTNLPLEFDLFDANNLNESIITSNEVSPDEDGSFFRTIKIPLKELSYKNNQTDSYVLTVNFPERYNEEIYQGIIDFISIKLKAEQKVSE